MSSHDLLDVLDGLGRPRVMVLGDLILDRYTWGNAERISQEAPVIVLRADRREARLGGAANVVNMLAALEADVSCCGVVGDDSAGSETRQLLSAAGAVTELVFADRSRPTSVKERFIGRASSRHPSQILRVDHEHCEPLSESLQSEIIARLGSRIGRHDLLLISDYGKGVCTERIVQAAIAAARAAGIPTIVDPSRGCPLSRYRGATIIKPNRLETELATGHKIGSAADALAAGAELCQAVDCQTALITLDGDGLLLANRDQTGQHFATQARAVYDITGAGDMVLAMFGLGLAAGATMADAARLANVAAGLEVERTGVAVILRGEIRAELLSGRGALGQKIVGLEQAASLVAERRQHGQKIVFTNGCFDLLHVGHVTYLADAARLGDVLVVGVNSDASVRKLKGEGRPVINQRDRAAMLAALACVSYVVVFDDDTPHALLQAIRPDVLVKGGTYAPSEVVGHEFVESYGGQVCVTGVVDGISTTNILASLGKGETHPTPEAKPTGATLRKAG